MAASLGPLQLARRKRRRRGVHRRITDARDIDFLTEIPVSVFGGISLNRVSLPGFPIEARLAEAAYFLGAAIGRTPI